ncbi:MAG: hypothetical protein BBJ57_11530 [Desulfobacterales bacterium PC51MH44]|nr:MAG: hypothetical protein BBJ57_11530 [Desulfobacterales bacterium PC51MH44]
MAFQVPALPEGSNLRLWFTTNSAKVSKAGLFAGRGLVFKDLIRHAFVQKGGISLDGYLTRFTENDGERPVFRTVIQPDADILCKIDRHVLDQDNFRQLFFGYAQVRRQFLEAFQKRVYFRIMQMIAVFFGGIGLLFGIITLLKHI